MKTKLLITVKVKKNNSIQLPTYSTPNSAGADIYSSEDLLIPSGKRALVHTGLRLAIPEGFEVQIRPRSGLALKHGITVLNTPGTIDSDYRGEVGVILLNTGDGMFEVKKGDRIAQMILNKVEQINWTEVEELPDTNRSTGGFGSTGR